MAIHCQCRPVITDVVVNREVEGFVHEHGMAPTTGQMAKRLSVAYGKPKCEGCTCKLPHNILKVMEQIAPETYAIAAE